MLMYPEFAPEVRAWIDRYRTIYEPARAKMVAPHVTLVFGVKQIAEPMLVELCENVARQQDAFDVSFEKVRFERDALDGMIKGYLEIGAGARQVRGLHHALYQGPHANEYRRDIAFVPHMTVATVGNETECEVAMKQADSIAMPVFGRMAAISVVRLSDGKVSEIAEIKLKG